MKKIKKIICLLGFLFSYPACFGQPPKPEPIPIEAFSSDKILALQVIVFKHLTPKCKFGFENVDYILGDYQNNKALNQYETLSFLTHDLYNSKTSNFSILGGMLMNYYYGFRPTAGFQYFFATPKILVVILPHIDLTETHNIETICLFEYKPKFSRDKIWGLYTSIQGLYNYNFKNETHDRSYIYCRAGVSYKQYAFGLGANTDWYGPQKINENTYGAFVRAEIF